MGVINKADLLCCGLRAEVKVLGKEIEVTTALFLLKCAIDVWLDQQPAEDSLGAIVG